MQTCLWKKGARLPHLPEMQEPPPDLVCLLAHLCWALGKSNLPYCESWLNSDTWNLSIWELWVHPVASEMDEHWWPSTFAKRAKSHRDSAKSKASGSWPSNFLRHLWNCSGSFCLPTQGCHSHLSLPAGLQSRAWWGCRNHQQSPCQGLVTELRSGLSKALAEFAKNGNDPSWPGRKILGPSVAPTHQKKIHNQTLPAGALVLRLRNKSASYSGAQELDESHAVPRLVHPQGQNIRNAVASRRNWKAQRWSSPDLELIVFQVVYSFIEHK